MTLRLPDLAGATPAQSALRLAWLWPQLLGYMTSFAIIGVLWINHHALFHFLKKVDRVSHIINLRLLMCVSFTPIRPRSSLNTGTIVPWSCSSEARWLLAGFIFSGLWFYAVKQYFRTEPRIDERFVRDASLWTLGYPLSYVVATLLVLIDTRVSISVYAAIPIVYLLPGVIDRQLHMEMTSRSYRSDFRE